MSNERISRTRRNLIAVGACLLAAAHVLLVVGCGRTDKIKYTCEGDRVVIVDLSSQNRSDASVDTAITAISGHELAAAVCQEGLTVIGVAGGRQVTIAPQTAYLDDLRGPNPRARANVVTRHSRDARKAVADELGRIYASFPAVDSTSIPALFEAAAAQTKSGRDTRILLLTTGVNIDPTTNLNRPLNRGEGVQLAHAMTWPTLGPHATVVSVGVSQMDSDLPVPGDLWPREVTAFVHSACGLAKARSCSEYQVATIDKVLL